VVALPTHEIEMRENVFRILNGLFCLIFVHILVTRQLLLSDVGGRLLSLRDFLKVLLNVVGLRILQDEARLFDSRPALANRLCKVCIVLISFTIVIGLEIQRVATWGKGIESKAGFGC
jgi:hypothetical protein